MLDRGYVVAATDYPGLGLPSFIPISWGQVRGIRCSTRSGRQERSPKPRLEHDSPYGAIRRAGRRLCSAEAARYAPELKLVGVAAAAPATDLGALMTDDLGAGGGNNITAMTLWSWARVYGAPMDKVIVPQAEPVIDHLTKLCIERWFDTFTRRGPTQALEKRFLRINNLAKEAPWRRLLEENLPWAFAKRRSQPSWLKDRPTAWCGPRSRRPSRLRPRASSVRAVVAANRPRRSVPSRPLKRPPTADARLAHSKATPRASIGNTPSAIAANTRPRRCMESGSAISAGLQSGRKLELNQRRFGNPYLRFNPFGVRAKAVSAK